MTRDDQVRRVGATRQFPLPAPAGGYSPGMIGKLFRLFALKRLFDMFRNRRGGRGRH